MAVLTRVDIGGVFYVSATFDPANAGANALSNQNVTVSLADNSAPLFSTDIIIPIPPQNLNTGLIVKSARYQSATQIAVTFDNITGSGIDAASATYEFLVFRR